MSQFYFRLNPLFLSAAIDILLIYDVLDIVQFVPHCV